MSALDPARLHVFCDFDGTITRPDTIQFLTERFGGGAELYRASGRLLGQGRVTLRDAIADGIGSIRAGTAELDNVTSQNAANSQQLAASAQETSAQVSALQELVLRFKTPVEAG